MIFAKIFKFIWSIVSKGGLKIRGVFSLMNNKAVYFKTFKAKIVNLDSGLNFTNVVLTFIIESVRKKVVSLSDREKRIYPRLLLLASFIFFACVIALRLRERLPSAIFPMSNLQWYIYLGILLINLIVFYLLIRNLLELKPNAYLANLAGKIKAFWHNSIFRMHEEYCSLLYYNRNIAYYLQYLLYLNYKFFSELRYTTQLGYYYVFLVIPKIIVCLAFSYDVLIGNNFLYFYKVLWLLLLPLFFRMFIYSIELLHIIELEIIALSSDIERLEREKVPAWEEFKAKIGMDQFNDENQTILLHVYNHVKNVLKAVICYPNQNGYTGMRQYVIYRRIWFTIMELESFQACKSKKMLELAIRLIYAINFAIIIIKPILYNYASQI